jgi:hypothetical protein
MNEAMSSRLEDAIAGGKALGKLALYFGCWDGPGHFLRDADGRNTERRRAPEDLPWTIELMDAGLLRNGKHLDVPDGRVWWTCGGAKAFWYAFYWWDRSVDQRGACNSGLYVRGFGWPESKGAFDYGCATFPHVVARQKFPLILQDH